MEGCSYVLARPRWRQRSCGERNARIWSAFSRAGALCDSGGQIVAESGVCQGNESIGSLAH